MNYKRKKLCNSNSGEGVVESFVVLAVDFVFASIPFGDVGDVEDGGFSINVVVEVIVFIDIFAVLGPANLWFGVSADGGGKGDAATDLDAGIWWSFFDFGGYFNDDFGGIESFSELVVGFAGVCTNIHGVAVGDNKRDHVGIFKKNLVFSRFLEGLAVLEPGNGWVREALHSADDLGSTAVDEGDILKTFTKESWGTVSCQLPTDHEATEAFLDHRSGLNDILIFKIDSELLRHDYGLSDS